MPNKSMERTSASRLWLLETFIGWTPASLEAEGAIAAAFYRTSASPSRDRPLWVGCVSLGCRGGKASPQHSSTTVVRQTPFGR